MKKIFIVVLIFSTFLLTSCFDGVETENRAYVVAIGIDKTDTKEMRYTFQYALPLNIDASENETLECETVQATNIYNASDIFNSNISKEINFSHLKLLVFNENVAYDGLERFKPMILSNTEILPSACITISKEPAKEYLENVFSPLELNPAKYYNFAFDEKNSPFSEAFYIKNIFEKTDYVIPFTNEGAVVFKDHKAVSALDDSEIPYYKLLAGTMNKFAIDFTGQGFSCNVIQKSKPSITIDKDNLNVYITLNLKFSFYGNPPKNAKILTETKIKQKCLNIIKKAQNKNTDIFNFEASFRPHFSTLPQFTAFDFKEKYQEIYFDIRFK